MSPYVFSRNNSVYFNDPTGLSPESDWDNYDTNDELDQNLYIDHAPGVFGQTVAESDMTSGTAEGGGELREAVVGNTYKEGYDKNGTIDNDDDGYSREDRANDKKALAEMASTYQNIGSVLTITGMVLTLTPLAPLGLALMASGSGLSIAGASISLIEDSFDGDDKFDTGKHIFDAASIVVPELFSKNFTNGAVGWENIYLESIFTGSGLWMDAVSKP